MLGYSRLIVFFCSVDDDEDVDTTGLGKVKRYGKRYVLFFFMK